MAKKKTGGLGRGLGSLFDDLNRQEEVEATRSALTRPQAEERGPVEEGAVVYISLDRIKANPSQPRKHFDQQLLQELADSIGQHGVIQPVLLRPSGKAYELVAGERRYRAARLAGLKEIPSIVRELDEQQNMLFALIENIQREDLNGIEEALGMEEMIRAYGLTQEEVARSVGKSRPYVTNALRLLKLPAEVQDFVTEGKLSAAHGRTIAGLKDEAAQNKAAQLALNRGWSVRELERYVGQRPGKKMKRKPGSRLAGLPLRQAEESLTSALGTKVRLEGTEERGQIRVDYYSREELERLLALLSESRR